MDLFIYYVFIYLFIYVYMYVFVFIYVCSFLHLFICHIFLFICFFYVFLFVCLFVYINISTATFIVFLFSHLYLLSSYLLSSHFPPFLSFFYFTLSDLSFFSLFSFLVPYRFTPSWATNQVGNKKKLLDRG